MEKSEKIKNLRMKINHDLLIRDVNTELKDQSSKFAYWGASHAIKLEEYQSKRHFLKEKEAELSKVVEHNLMEAKKTDSRVRITDKVINSNVVLDPGYKLLQRQVLELGLEEGILSTAKEAFRQRSHLLLEMARQERYELSVPERVFVKKVEKEMG